MTTVSQLNPATAPGNADLLPISQAGNLNAVTIAQLQAAPLTAAAAAAAASVPTAAPIITAPLSNPAVIAESYTIPADSNAVSVGPITIAVGASVTVPVGSTWKVL